MRKYLFFNAQTPYSDFLYSELKNRDDVVWYQNPKNKILKKIRDLHTSIKGNSRFILPFQYIWYKWLLNLNSDIKPEDVFIFEEGNKFSYSPGYMKHLMHKYPGCKRVFLFMNPVSTIPTKYIDFIIKYFDMAITFNECDHKKFGFIHYSGIYSKKNVELSADDNICESDVFFVGQDKGRLAKIRSIKEYLTSLGFVCDFYVSGVEKRNVEFKSGIKYNTPLSYNDVIKHILKTKCILEILQENQNGSSLRAMEALVYEKKLISNNLSIKQERFFNSDQMLIINAPEDVSPEFIKRKINNSYNGSVSPHKLLEFIDNQLLLL